MLDVHRFCTLSNRLFFKLVRKSFVAFVWNDKRPRLAYDILRRSKVEGGMRLPDISFYYRAISLVRILNWCHDSQNKLWVPLEKIMAGRNLAGAPWIPSTLRGLSKWTSPLTQNFLSVWDKLNKTGKYAPPMSPLAPLEGFLLFPLGEETGYLGTWGQDGDTTCG